MSAQPTIKQPQCDSYRKDLYDEIERVEDKQDKKLETLNEKFDKLSKEVSAMQGAKRYAQFITPIIVTAILTIGGYALSSVMKNTVKDAVKQEMKEHNTQKKSDGMTSTAH